MNILEKGWYQRHSRPNNNVRESEVVRSREVLTEPNAEIEPDAEPDPLKLETGFSQDVMSTKSDAEPEPFKLQTDFSQDVMSTESDANQQVEFPQDSSMMDAKEHAQLLAEGLEEMVLVNPAVLLCLCTYMHMPSTFNTYSAVIMTDSCFFCRFTNRNELTSCASKHR